MHPRVRPLICALAVALSLVALGAPAAKALDLLRLEVPHIDYDFLPILLHSSAAVSAQMTLQTLGLPDTVTTQDIFNYGRSLEPAFAPGNEFSETSLATTLNHFETDPDYGYAVIHGNDYTSVISQIAYWMNRDIPDVPVVNAPSVIPLYGVYERWVVLTGTFAELDPYMNPSTTIYGLWLDDPQLNGNDNDPNVFYVTGPDPNIGLGEIFKPMTTGPYIGEYVAVVPVPEPATLGLVVLPLMWVLEQRKALSGVMPEHRILPGCVVGRMDMGIGQTQEHVEGKGAEDGHYL